MHRFSCHSLLIIFSFIVLLFMVLAACQRPQTPVANTAVFTPTTTAAVLASPTPTHTPAAPTPTPGPGAWPPQVVYSSPLPGETVLLDGAMTIRFDQPMDQAAVEAAFTIDPAPEEGIFDWPRPDTLVYTPVQPWQRQQTYQVRIGQTAVSQAGIPLEEDVELSLQTVGYLAVSQAMPTGEDVAVDTAVTVIFNRPIVPLVTSAQQADLPQPLHFSPAVAGHGEWLSASIYRFLPDGSLMGGTTYQVSIAAGLSDTTGAILESPYTWTFRTVAPDVSQIQFPPGSLPYLDPTASITLTFNMPMERTTTETAVHLAPAPAGGLNFTWDETQQILAIQPAQPLALATEYTLTLDTTAQARDGGAPLAAAQVSHFTTYPYPAVLRTVPAERELWDVNQWEYGHNQPPFIEFAGPMDADSLAGRITIEPAPAAFDTFYHDWTDWNGQVHHELALDFAELRDQAYTITLSADIQDVFGNRLGQDFTWHFTTIPYLPLASLNFPSWEKIMLLSDSFPTAVDLVYRNVSTVTVSLHDARMPVYYLTHSYDIDKYKPPFLALRSWTIPSTAVADEAVIEHILLADGGTLPPGVYYIEASAAEIAEPSRWQTPGGFLIVADTNLAVKEMLDTTYVWATEIATGTPAVGRTITLYGEDGSNWGTAVTGAHGFAAIPYDGTRETRMVAVSGDPGAAGFGLAYAGWGVSSSGYSISPENPYRAYLHTDRPIYRPGDTVYFKGIVRDQDYGRYHQPTLDAVNIDVSGQWPVDNASIYHEELPLDERGAVDGQFTLPVDLEVGTYNISISSTSGHLSSNYLTFAVAEYRKPELYVSVIPTRPQALLGEAVDVVVEAAYFFGGPAADLPLEWRIYRSGRGTISGAGVTDSNGRFTFTIPADSAPASQNKETASVSVEVNGLGELPLSAAASVTFHPAEVAVQSRPQRTINQAGQEMNIEVTTVDWDDNPAPARPVTVTLTQVEWVWGTNAYGRDAWIPQLTDIATVVTTTSAAGEAMVPFTPPAAGTYRVTAVAADENGRLASGRQVTFQAVGPGRVRYPLEKFKLELEFDQEEYIPGDTARLLIQSDFSEPALAWLTIEQGPRLEQQLITLTNTSHLVDIPVLAAYAPEVEVTVTAVQGTNGGRQFATMRWGEATMTVSPQQLVLTLTMTPTEMQFLPGTAVQYEILVTDYSGQPVAADLSLALVDLAVLSLKPDNTWPILSSFYDYVPDVSIDGGSLYRSGEGLAVTIPIEPGGGGGGGGDGGGDDSQPVYSLEDETRRDFPDTAYWQASLTTDENGRAQVSIPLPDSLTTWRLSSKAVSLEGTLVGQDSVDIHVSKPLLLRPVTPRFFTVGDRMNLGSFVHNNTAADLDVTVSLEATGVQLTGTAVQTITVAAGGSEWVQWPVQVPDVERVDLTFRATAGEYTDTTKPTFGLPPDQSLPVYRYDAPDMAGAAGVLDTAGQAVEAVLLPDTLDAAHSQLHLQLNASLAAGMVGAREEIEQRTRTMYCVTDVSDRLLADAASQLMGQQLQLDAASSANRRDDAIAADLAQLERLALPGGGWSWCGGRQPDPLTTAFVLFSLAQARNAGHAADAEALAASLTYLSTQVNSSPRGLSGPSLANRRAFFLYVLALHGRDVSNRLDDLLLQSGNVLDPYGKALVLMAYDLTITGAPAPGGHLSEGEDETPMTRKPITQTAALLADLNAAVVLSAAGAHWQDAAGDWRNANSDVRSTAIIIHALVQVDPTNPLLPLAVRWLMSARTAVHWSTTHETAWSILALGDWMALTGELQPDFTYTVQANGENLATGTMTAATAAEAVDLWLPATGLQPDEVNLLAIARDEGNGRLYYTTYLEAAVAAAAVPAANRGIMVTRTYYDADCNPHTEACPPITHIAAGQKIRVQLDIQALSDLVYATIDDPIPAGTETLDPYLLTVSRAYAGQITRTDLEADYHAGYWGWWYFNDIQYRDDRVQFISDFLPAGTYQYTYYLQAILPGEYQVRPTLAQQTFFPEVFGRSEGMLLTITAE